MSLEKSTPQSISRREFLRLGSFAAGATLLVACAPATTPGDASTEGDADASQEEIVVTAWAHWEQGLDWIDNALTNYGWKDNNPNVSLNKVVQPFGEVHDKMLAACASGVGAPDIMRIEQGRMSAFFKGEPCFVDLTDFIGDRIDDLVLGSATDYWSWQGKIYGIGNEMNACALAYREAILEEVGVGGPFETWDDLVEAGQVLREAKDMAMISFHDVHSGDFEMMLFSSGGLVFDENGDFGGLNDLGREILDFQRKAIHEWNIADVAPVTGDSTWAPPIYWETFRQDQIACTMGAPWHNGNLGFDTKIGPSQEGEWRLQGLPAGFGEGKPTASHGGTSVSIPRTSELIDTAWAIIEETHLTNAVLQDFEERGILVSYKPALADPVYQEPKSYYGGQVIGDLYLGLAEEMPRIHQSPWAPEFRTAFVNLILTPILQDQANIDAGFAELEVELERLKNL